MTSSRTFLALLITPGHAAPISCAVCQSSSGQFHRSPRLRSPSKAAFFIELDLLALMLYSSVHMFMLPWIFRHEASSLLEGACYSSWALIFLQLLQIALLRETFCRLNIT